MKTKIEDNSIFRVIDANINRFKEGIRVVEDIMRYIFNDENTSKQLKKIRHINLNIDYKTLLNNRDIQNDVLKKTISTELERANIEDIIISNIKRAQESARVLEEIFKLIDNNYSEEFKQKRYKLYEIEKSIFNNI